MRSRLSTILFFLVSLISPLLLAAKFDATQVVTAKTKADFVVQSDMVLKGIEPGGRYEFVTPKERTTVKNRLVEMQTIFDHYVEGTRLDDPTMMKILTAQEEVNGILNHRDRDRLVCSNTVPTGSHRPLNNCKRYGDIENSHKATKKLMEDFLATPCASKECRGN
jgi:hypothetical protein